MTDIIFDNQGSIIVLTPVSPVGERWLDDNVFGQFNGPPVSVDFRYADDIIDAAIDNGLEVASSAARSMILGLLDTGLEEDNKRALQDVDRDHKIRAFARAEWGAEPGGDFEDAMVIEHDAEVDITSTGYWVQAWVYVPKGEDDARE